VLDQVIALLVPFGADLRTVAVDRAVNILADTNQEVLARLDRIEGKLDALKNKDAATGWQHLRQASERHRSAAEQEEQIRLALRAFVGAASSASDDAMSRSVARVYQAVCWACLGSPDDVGYRLDEAVTDAYDALYQVAVEYNRPRRTAAANKESWLGRYRPGSTVTDPKVRMKMAVDGEATALERFMGSSMTTAAVRLQGRMEAVLDQANTWAHSVTELRARVQDRSRAGQPAAAECSVRSAVTSTLVRQALWGPPRYETALRRAYLEIGLPPTSAVDVHGVIIKFAHMVPQSIAGSDYTDVCLTVDVRSYIKRERTPPSRARPWCVDNQGASTAIAGGEQPAGPRWHPRDLDQLPHPRLMSDTSKWMHGNGSRLGPGFQNEITGWRRFPSTRNYDTEFHLTLTPAGPLWPLPSPGDPRPDIKVKLNGLPGTVQDRE
jgi:hypothetical protein